MGWLSDLFKSRRPTNTPGSEEGQAPPPPLDLLLWGEATGEARLERREVGRLNLPGGRIAAMDPLALSTGTTPFERAVTPGSYPVTLTIACFPDDQRVAAAVLRLSEAEVVHWEPALLDGGGEGYGVDSGTGCFADAEAARWLEAAPDEVGQRMLRALEARYVHTWATFSDSLHTEHDIIGFSSGWGDGLYGSWWGLDAAGAPVVLLTDFGVA